MSKKQHQSEEIVSNLCQTNRLPKKPNNRRAIVVFRQALLLSLIVASPAFAANTLPYGSRCGQENEIVSRSGLNTKKAVIKTRPSKSLAREVCTCYMGDKSKKCIRELMASLARATTIVKANCKKMVFTTLYEANWLIRYVDGKFIDVAKG